MNTHDLYYGDSLTPIGLKFKQRNTSGDLANVDLTDKTVKVLICDHAGNVVVAETTTGVTVTTATAGEVSYDFPSGSSALAGGTYYLYARVYVGGQRDTYPVVAKQMQIKVHEHVLESTSS
jgi:hypothetical protein